MKKIKLFSLICLSILLFACQDKQSTSNRNIKSSVKCKLIVVQPYNDLDAKQATFIINEIKKVCPNVKVNAPIPIHPSAYYAKNNRYRADSLIIIQKRIANGKYTLLGLTSKDISHTKGKIKDYGIMGLGYCPGTACIVSNKKLLGKNRMEKFRKVTLHELAHTEGLPHCPDPHCYMRDAKGKDYLNEEVDFCDKCKGILKTKGWTL